MPSNYAMKNTAMVGKNKGSSILRFQEVDSLGVPLLPSAVDVFGNKGGIIYEAPFLKTSMDSDKTPIEKITDETGSRITSTFGDRERVLSGEFLGTYEELCFDDSVATQTIATAVKASGVVTITSTAAISGYAVGDYVNVFLGTTATGSAYNGLHKVISTAASALTYNFGSETVASAALSGTIGNAASAASFATKAAGTPAVVTITCAAAHNHLVGQTVRISCGNAAYDGVHVITATTASTFTYSYGTASAASAGGSAFAAAYFNLESLLVSGTFGRQFKVWYYSPVKTAVLSTDIAYNKYIYWIGRFTPEYEDKRDAASSKSIPFTFTPETLPTAIVDQVGGQIFTKIRVPSIPAATAVDSAELQTQSLT